jgi:pyruvyltransferase
MWNFMNKFIKNFLLRLNPKLGHNLPARYFHWQPLTHTIKYNFGDDLVKIIAQKLAKSESPELFCKDNYLGRKVLCGGSTLHFADNNDMVWGTGVRDVSQKHYFKSLDVRSVRGPLTHDFLKKKGITCPEIYGDPALLIPTLFPEVTTSDRHEIGYVPHYLELSGIKNDKSLKDFKIITPDQPGLMAVKEIVQCRAIISSSLHGLVVADAFNIPCVFINKGSQPLYKYQDYFLSVQKEFRFAKNSKEAQDFLGSYEKAVLPNIGKLIESFPILDR